MGDLGGSAGHLAAPPGPAERHSGPVPEAERMAAGEAESKVESEIHPGQRLFLLGRDLEGKAQESSLQMSSHPNRQCSFRPLKAQAQREHCHRGREGQKVARK